MKNVKTSLDNLLSHFPLILIFGISFYVNKWQNIFCVASLFYFIPRGFLA